MSEKNEWKLVPVDRSYDMRVKALIAFNTAEQSGKDRDDALDAAFQAMLGAAPCPTCNDRGAVGNILTAEPCRDCSPASVAPGDAQDERQAFEAWFARRGVWPALCFEEVFIAGWNARPADAPAAGDALDAARYRWLREKAHQTAGRAPAAVLCDESDMFQRGEAGSESGFIHGKDLDAAIDAALAAQQGKGGEA